MDSYLQNYINGQWVDSIGGKRHQVISPSTEEACTEIVLGTKADVDAAVAAAKEAFKTFSQTTREERIALMERVVEEYKKRAGDLAASMSNEMGAPLSFASTAQVGAGIGWRGLDDPPCGDHRLGEAALRHQRGMSALEEVEIAWLLRQRLLRLRHRPQLLHRHQPQLLHQHQ